ncbi:conjugative transposon protein TraM [Flavobacterium sp. I-SCBP12n]|uniref:Conjugative transposon protein TraM n=1 Tax=Flavobacterium pygoscelis TaxID=2893176 RepID=A0A9X1XVT7_9FLAO|nr:conjugative transposon protein TraM [Flavobacterium pygoscelis]MCK8142531.1 conjugative transposon protein TraM [Flavobacterium pygoscelis]
MKESENKKNTVLVTDGNLNESTDIVREHSANKLEKFKKPILFALMSIVFLGCMYLIFKPSEDIKKKEGVGLNDSVPQASTVGLQHDKQKAYEQELVDEKNQQKQNTLSSLSDYWSEGNPHDAIDDDPENEKEANANTSLNSYRNAKKTLGTFYENDTAETQELQKQLDELKAQLARKDEAPMNPVDIQLELMEKSYQMAAKYLPTNTASTEKTVPIANSSSQKESFISIVPARKSAVSSLHRDLPDSTFIANWSESRNRGFITVGKIEQESQPKNSVRAIIQTTQVVSVESNVRLRLLEPAKMQNRIIPQGTVLTANSKFNQGRLQMKISSIELDGTILPVDLTIYGLDGQQGLFVPYSPEMSAVKEMAANMGQTSGSSIMLSSSPGQQIAGDLSRGLVQGISGYFSKKMKTPKVTLKSGLQVFLVSKN